MTQKTPHIIVARASNIDLFDQVAPGVFDAPIDPTRLRAYLDEPSHFIVLALLDGLVVGQLRRQRLTIVRTLTCSNRGSQRHARM